MRTVDLTPERLVPAVNAGSAEAKLILVDRDERITPISGLGELLGRPAAVSHRVVFGGSREVAQMSALSILVRADEQQATAERATTIRNGSGPLPAAAHLTGYGRADA